MSAQAIFDLYVTLKEAKAFIMERHTQLCNAVYRSEELEDNTAFADIDAYSYNGDGASMFAMIDEALDKVFPLIQDKL